MKSPGNRHFRTTAGRLLSAWAMVAALTLAPALYHPAVAISISPPSHAQPKLFGSNETRSQRTGIFPKWKGMLTRYFDERKLADAPCESSFFNRCHLKEWSAFLNRIHGQDPLRQIREVNRMMNRQRYIIDLRNYGVTDYWASPLQFLTRDGDCEDYAITKYMSLRALGFDTADMRIVVLNDLNLGIAHAILVVYYQGQVLVLDNQIRGVVAADAIRHYRAIYSINEQSWWLHTM